MVDFLLMKHLLIVFHINTYFLLAAVLIALDKLVYTVQTHFKTWELSKRGIGFFMAQEPTPCWLLKGKQHDVT